MNPLWHHITICMISHPLYLWCHIQFLWYHPYCFHDNTTTIPDVSAPIFDITATVSVSSHQLYRWHHKYGIHHIWHTYDIIHTLREITLTIYVINAQYLWHHNHYIWHHIHAISVITSTVLIKSHQLYLWDLISYIWWHHIHCTQHIHYICNITAVVSMSQTHSFRDITPFVWMTLHPLYV